jgi:hypothetical protein
MPTPLKITFTVELPDGVLERGPLLSAALDAAEAFQMAMDTKGHKVEYRAEEGVQERRGRKAKADTAPVVVARGRLTKVAG